MIALCRISGRTFAFGKQLRVPFKTDIVVRTGAERAIEVAKRVSRCPAQESLREITQGHGKFGYLNHRYYDKAVSIDYKKIQLSGKFV